MCACACVRVYLHACVRVYLSHSVHITEWDSRLAPYITREAQWTTPRTTIGSKKRFWGRQACLPPLQPRDIHQW